MTADADSHPIINPFSCNQNSRGAPHKREPDVAAAPKQPRRLRISAAARAVTPRGSFEPHVLPAFAGRLLRGLAGAVLAEPALGFSFPYPRLQAQLAAQIICCQPWAGAGGLGGPGPLEISKPMSPGWTRGQGVIRCDPDTLLWQWPDLFEAQHNIDWALKEIRRGTLRIEAGVRWRRGGAR